MPTFPNRSNQHPAEVLHKQGVENFCQERLATPADNVAAVLEWIGEPFTNLMAQYSVILYDGGPSLKKCLFS